MTVSISTGLANRLLNVGSFQDVMADSVLEVYSGTQPANADAATTGSLLVTVTKSSATFTAETKAVGMVTLAGASGSVDTITLAGISILGTSVPYNTSLNQTAVDVAAMINNCPSNTLVVASATGASAVVTLTAVNGMGARLNGLTIAGTGTTLTVTATNGTMGSGTSTNTVGVAAANGLRFGAAASGAISKIAADTWSGNVSAAGNAGWFRLRISGDGGASDSTGLYPRYDGAISTSGAQMNLGSLALTLSAPFIISGATFTLPLA